MKLPASVYSPLGPVPVTLATGLEGTEKMSTIGQWDPLARTIKIDAETCDATKLATLYHEVCHVALWDAGVVISDDVLESVCDAVGTYLAAATLAGYVTLKAGKK